MIIYPAIDLIEEKAVRLEQGDYVQKTEYFDDPVEVARRFASAGAGFLHVVDLDGAKAGRLCNFDVIRDISVAAQLPVQAGGGVRSVESAKKLLEYVDRVIIGTAAINKPEFLNELIKKNDPGKIVVSVDYKDGLPAVNGWLESVSVETGRLQAEFVASGVKIVIITDVARDGMMKGPNIELVKQWKDAGFETICAGGITSLQDIKNLRLSGIDGAIIGKALYEGRINLKEAINAG